MTIKFYKTGADTNNLVELRNLERIEVKSVIVESYADLLRSRLMDLEEENKQVTRHVTYVVTLSTN